MLTSTMKELLDRTRRIETRLVRFMEASGVVSGGQKPVWDAEKRQVSIPSYDCSLSDCINAIPDQFTKLVPVVTGGGETIGFVYGRRT